MPQTPQFNLSEIDLTQAAAQISAGRSGVMVKTKRGPVADPSQLITSWPMFQRIYGGLLADNDGPLLAKRALDRGSALRVSRMVGFQSSASDETPYSATKAGPVPGIYIVLASALVTGQTITFNWASYVIAQAFTTNGLKTLQALATKVKSLVPEVVDFIVIDSTHAMFAISNGSTTPTIATSGAAAPAVTKTTSSIVKTATGEEVFSGMPKYPGADYNNAYMLILPASNGKSDSFNLQIVLDSPGETEPIIETYQNLKIVGKPTAAASVYLKRATSQLLDFTYENLSAIAGSVTPVPAIIKFAGATDGDALVAADYIGDASTKTGFNSFDGIDDVMQIVVLDDISALSGVHEAGDAYVQSRKDMQQFIHLYADTENALAAERQAINVDSSYNGFFGGGIEIVDPLTSEQRIISEIGDVLGIAAYSETNFGPYRSFSGVNRGRVLNSLGSGNNFGAAGNTQGLNILANNQINVVIDRSHKTVLWGSFTGQTDYSQLSYMNVRRLHIFIKKSLTPLLEPFLEEPNDFPTWKLIFIKVRPFLDSLKRKRAIFEYSWQGDQFAKSLDQLVINNADDVGLGKYKAKLFTKDIVSLQEFELQVILTPSGLSFEDAQLVTSN